MKTIFTDRTKQDKFIIKDISAQTEKTAVISREQDTSANKSGTALNAANLNKAFAEKQNKLIPGKGIGISDNNIIYATLAGYAPLAATISADNYTVNYSAWKAAPKSSYYEYGKHYLAEFINSSFKFAEADITFTASDINYGTATDADPTVVVKFEDSDNEKSVYCVFGFIKKRVRLIKGKDWKPMGVKENIAFPEENGIIKPFEIKIIRKMTGSGLFAYRFFLNDNYLAEFYETDAEQAINFNAVKIGTIGCRATITGWKADGIF